MGIRDFLRLGGNDDKRGEPAITIHIIGGPSREGNFESGLQDDVLSSLGSLDLGSEFGSKAAPLNGVTFHAHDPKTNAITKIVHQIELPSGVKAEGVKTEVDEYGDIQVDVTREPLFTKPEGFCDDVRGSIPDQFNFTARGFTGLKPDGFTQDLDVSNGRLTIDIAVPEDAIRDPLSDLIAELRAKAANRQPGAEAAPVASPKPSVPGEDGPGGQ